MRSLVLDLLRLVRFPTVFTAVADIVLGFVLTHRGLEPWSAFLPLLGASICLYWAGMVSNDVFDFAQDSQERSHRPLAAGRISRRFAIALTIALFVLGLVFAGLVPSQTPRSAWRPQTSLAIAGLLVIAILAYNGPLKRTLLGPWMMGTCRGLNVLLGASQLDLVYGLQLLARPQIVCALGLALYIAGVTWFARNEAATSRKSTLVLGLSLSHLGLALLAWLIWTWPNEGSPRTASLMLAMAAVSITVRAVDAIRLQEPRLVQLGVKWMLLWYVTIDAALVYWHTGSAPLAMGTAALIFPALLLSRLIAMT